MSKLLKIELYGPYYEFSDEHTDRKLYLFDCNNIITNLNDESYSSISDLRHAIGIIIAHFMANEINRVVVDIDELNESLAPRKEMTINDIEKELGYKIKIVSEEEKND